VYTHLQAYSDWLYVVPWGIYKAVIWTKEKFNNPVIIIGENGSVNHQISQLIANY
jgi:hypothetical protein